MLSTWDYWFKNQEKYTPSSLDILSIYINIYLNNYIKIY